MATEQKSDFKPWPPVWRGWLATGLLALASIASQFDRTVVSLVVEPLKTHYSLTDTQFVLLPSVAFGLFYALASFPIGRLVDRFPRRSLLSICLALFSLFSMGSGLARNYVQLFLTRVGVGIGEASVTPGAMSMLSDHFPPEKLGKPIGAFGMSMSIGQGLAVIAGGLLLQALTNSPLLDAGLLSGFEPWQVAFLVIGFPGLLLAPLFLLLPEPERRGPGAESALSLRQVGSVLHERRATLIPMFAGFSMVTLVSFSLSTWIPAMLQRTYGWSIAQVGLWYGMILLVFGTAGTWCGGWLCDRLGARGVLDAPLRVAGFGFALCSVCGVLATQMPSAPLALLLLAPTLFLSNIPYACAGLSIQLITPNRARGQVTAIYISILTLVGLAIGPTVVGLMTDYVFQDPADVRYSLAIVVGIPGPIMLFLLAKAIPHYRALRLATAG